MFMTKQIKSLTSSCFSLNKRSLESKRSLMADSGLDVEFCRSLRPVKSRSPLKSTVPHEIIFGERVTLTILPQTHP